MTWLEEMAISILLGAIQQFIKNPTKAAAARAVLLNLADSIDESYGIVPPTHT